MLKVEIRPDWILRHASGKPVSLPALLGLLGGEQPGSISKAATARGMSYRHAWGCCSSSASSSAPSWCTRCAARGRCCRRWRKS
jgi:hypothetical protein